MGFSVVCHECDTLLYEGTELIPLYRLRLRTDGKCPNCGKRLGVRPLSIEFHNGSLTNLVARKPKH